MKTLMKVLLLPLVLGACAGAPARSHGEDHDTAATTSAKKVGATIEEHVLINPDSVTWGEGPPALPPGAMMAILEGDPKAPDALFTIRLKLPDGYTVSPHFHPADEHVTVISGTFNMGMGDVFDKSATTALPAGSFAVMPTSHAHFAWADGETIVQIHAAGPWGITYLNPDDDPRKAK